MKTRLVIGRLTVLIAGSLVLVASAFTTEDITPGRCASINGIC